MFRIKSLLSVAFIGFLIPLALSANAKVALSPGPILDMAQESSLIVIGTVASIEGETANIKISQTLFGKASDGVISVFPVSINTCKGRYLDVKAGDEVALMLSLTPEKNSYAVIGDGQGKIVIKPENKQYTVDAINCLIGLSKITDEDSLNKAMLSSARTENPVLRREICSYITLRIAYSKLAKNYADNLLALLKFENTDVQKAVVAAMRHVKINEAIPFLISATSSKDPVMVHLASEALVQYDTPVTVAALIALSHSEYPMVRCCAAVDLDTSRRPEAKSRLIEMLDDPDADVRAIAPGRMVNWFRRGQGDDVIPKILDMINDPVEAVQVAAAYAIGESRRPSVIQPLLDILRRPNLSEELEKRAMQSLSMVFQDPKKEYIKLVGQHTQLIIEVMERGHAFADMEAAGLLSQIRTPEAIAALKKAADSAPREENRQYAKRLLANIEKEAK